MCTLHSQVCKWCTADPLCLIYDGRILMATSFMTCSGLAVWSAGILWFIIYYFLEWKRRITLNPCLTSRIPFPTHHLTHLHPGAPAPPLHCDYMGFKEFSCHFSGRKCSASWMSANLALLDRNLPTSGRPKCPLVAPIETIISWRRLSLAPAICHPATSSRWGREGPFN